MKRIKYLVFAVLWACAIYKLSSMPKIDDGIGSILIVRKCAHVFVYFILTFLIYHACKRCFSFRGTALYAVSGLIPFFYAISDEIHQFFVPTRVCAPKDVLIDMIGILICYFVVRFFERSKRERLYSRRYTYLFF